MKTTITTIYNFDLGVGERNYHLSMYADTEAEARLKLIEDLKNISDQLEPLV